MKVNGFKCDNCDNMCNSNEFKGWIFARFHEANSGYREQHFCSSECLVNWASLQISGGKEYVGDEFGGLIEVTSSGEK